MKVLPFKKSALGTIGVEIELQIIDSKTFKLASSAPQLLDTIYQTKYEERITHEITQGMIEINTSAHDSPDELLAELFEIKSVLLEFAEGRNISFCGGGTHPFQDWHDQKIFPDKRYKRVLKKFQFLCKQATIFGQHVHFGCENAEDAIYLTHALAQYMPQLIALSCCSPFYQGIDSGFCSVRNTQFNSFPICGHMPFVQNWEEFSDYYYKMKGYGLIESMKDAYWDVRPKPEFGTVEVRIFDAPLTLHKAAALGAFVQALSLYLLAEKPFQISEEHYQLYGSNRFQASRYGTRGKCADAITAKNKVIKNMILDTFNNIEKYSVKGKGGLLSSLKNDLINDQSDAVYLRNKYHEAHSLEAVVAEQCSLWKNEMENR